MKILSQHAETALFEKAKSLIDAPGSWRCIYLNLSDRPLQNSSLRDHFIINALTELLGDMDGYIYLCNDGDIVVLFQGAVRPVMQRLSAHFHEIRLQSTADNDDGLCAVFDLGHYWNLFFRLCRSKAFPALPGRGKETAFATF